MPFTLEKPTFCGKEAHIHSDECYEYILDCPVTGEKGAALTFEEFIKLPGAAEALEKFRQAEEEREDQRISEGKPLSQNGTGKDPAGDTVVSKATEPLKTKEDVATSSDYPASEKDIYLKPQPFKQALVFL